MILKEFLTQLYGSQISYDELSLLDEDLSFDKQLFLLQEDLLQVKCRNNLYLLDVGWYPEFDIQGFFNVKIIKQYNWENPIFQKKATDIATLKQILIECSSILGSVEFLK